jgi:hypothetical protein
LRTEIRSDHHEGATHTKNTHASSLWCEENVRLDASDDQPLSLAERAVASAFMLMTLTLRIETRRRGFFFPREFLVARAARRMEKKTPSVGRVGRVGRASTRGEG